MQRLYSHISSGRSPDEALTLAKSDLISMGGPIANPYFWAGFIHIGAPRDLVKEAA
jgi:CHAT domain-containing protein